MYKEKIEAAIEDIQNGKFVIVTDDADRENEGDLIMASEMITPEESILWQNMLVGLYVSL